MLGRSTIVRLVSLWWIGWCLGVVQAEESLPESNSHPEYRRPVDLLLDSTGERVLVACAGTGNLELYHLQSQRHILSLHLAKSIDRLIRINESLVVAISTQAHQTTILRWQDDSLHAVAEIANSHSPVNAVWDNQLHRLFVACLWSRRIDCVDLSGRLDAWMRATSNEAAIDHLQPNGVWDLDIAPREMVLLDSQRRLIVADSFGREMVVLNCEDGQPQTTHDFFGTSIRGLVHFKDRLVVLHAMLNEYARTDHNEIHWGVLMANGVRLVSIDRLLNEQGDNIYIGGRVNPLGVLGNGSAEPTDLHVHGKSGRVAVSIGGTDMLAIGKTDGYTYQYIPVGRYPSAVQWSEDGKWVVVANQFDDSLSIVDVEGRAVSSVISLGLMRNLSESELGEQLFHSGALSHDRWLNCASCHVDGHTNGQLTDNFGDQNFGAPKRVPTLYGVENTGPFTWLGLQSKLEDQIDSSIHKTMQKQGDVDERDVKRLIAYMESLPPAPALSTARGDEDQEAIARGKNVFESRACSHCHEAPLYTTVEVYDVGLKDEQQKFLFNPPSLRGVSQRGNKLFHDNRANGLRGVLVDQKHQLTEPFNEEELSDLIAFLNSI